MEERQGIHPTRDLDQANLVTVAKRQCEASASVLVSVLQDEGIRAIATGGYTAGFRAEAPGVVRVLTFEADAERAREIISEIEEEIRQNQNLADGA
ncbi:MAG: putative signal transducing protein [Rubripirellula sp.]